MKRMLLCFILSAICILASSCDNIMIELTIYLQNDDIDNVRKLFAKRLYEIDSFETDLQNLIEYYK